jgi:hypothetical protein
VTERDWTYSGSNRYRVSHTILRHVAAGSRICVILPVLLTILHFRPTPLTLLQTLTHKSQKEYEHSTIRTQVSRMLVKPVPWLLLFACYKLKVRNVPPVRENAAREECYRYTTRLGAGP